MVDGAEQKLASTPAQQRMRYLKIGGAALAGGALLAVTGALTRPAAVLAVFSGMWLSCQTLAQGISQLAATLIPVWLSAGGLAAPAIAAVAGTALTTVGGSAAVAGALTGFVGSSVGAATVIAAAGAGGAYAGGGKMAKRVGELSCAGSAGHGARLRGASRWVHYVLLTCL